MKRLLFILSFFVANFCLAQNQHVKSPDSQVLPEIKMAVAANGWFGSTNAAGYNFSKIDSAYFAWNTNNGADQGGWLATNASGDSCGVTMPFGVVFGNSIAEGHTTLHGREHPLIAGVATNTFQANYPDSIGQITYRLDQITHYAWYNGGIGGQTTTQLLARFYRDVLAFNSNPNDARGSQTLSRMPFICVMDGGVNDIQTPFVVEANLELMAGLCQAFNIRLVLMNVSGDSVFNAIADSAQLRGVATVNLWLKNGGLAQYGTCIFDYNFYWNNYGGYKSTVTSSQARDNVHRNPNFTWSDDIHPSKNTYDSIATHLVADCAIPVMTKVIFVNELAKANPLGNYARPANITINGVAFTIARSTDTLVINQFLGNVGALKDSVYIKIVSSTTVAGAGTQSGFSHIMWVLDNNPNNQVMYTQRLFPKSTNPNYNGSSIKLTARDLGTSPVFEIFNYDGTIQMNFVGGSQPFFVYGGGTQHTTFTHTLTGTVYISGQTTTAAGVIANNLLQLGYTTVASGTGNGVGVINGGNRYDGSGGYTTAAPTNHIFSTWLDHASVSASNANLQNAIFQSGYDNITGASDSIYQITIKSPINNTTGTNVNANVFGGINLIPTITSQGAIALIGFRNTFGTNIFNAYAGITGVGAYSPDFSAKFSVTDTARGFLLPRMTTGRRDSVGYVGSITMSNVGTYAVLPTFTVTSATGKGAVLGSIVSGVGAAATVLDGGYGYKPGSSATLTVAGPNTGTAAVGTVNISSPTAGLQIYNTTTNEAQVYNGTVWADLAASSSGQTTLISGTKAITITGVTTSSKAFITVVTPSGTSLTTMYQAICTANTVTIQANVAAGTINSSDGSTLNYYVIF